MRIVEATKAEAGRRTMTVPPFLVDRLAAHVAAHKATRAADRVIGTTAVDDAPAGPLHPASATPDDLIFTGPKGGLLRRSFLARTLKPAVARAGLPETITFHGLRHVATSLMVATGEHPRVIQARLGPADPHLSMGLYAHVPDELDRAAAVRLQDVFSANRASNAAVDEC